MATHILGSKASPNFLYVHDFQAEHGMRFKQRGKLQVTFLARNYLEQIP